MPVLGARSLAITLSTAFSSSGATRPPAGMLLLAVTLSLWVFFDAKALELAGRSTPAFEAETVADYETLLYKFDRTVFRSDDGPYSSEPIPHTYKSVQSVSFALFGQDTERFRDWVVDVIAELSLLTGLDMAVTAVDEFEARNFLVAVLPPDLIEAMLGRSDIVARFGDLRPYDGSCFALPYVEGYEITKGIAIAPSSLPHSWIRYCLMVEITQAFGLFADSDVLEPSIFSDHGLPRDQLPINDKIIMRTLYDPRITPGMPREEALEVAREVIRELVDAVRRDGAEALYQRPAGSPHP